MLRSYIPVINTSIFPKKYYDNIFSEKLINKLHASIDIHPYIIHSHNVKDSLFVKNNGNLVKKQKHQLQISVRELHSDMILPISEGGFLVQKQLMETFVWEIRHLGGTCHNILNQ